MCKNEYKNTRENYYDSNKHLNFQYADTTVGQQASEFSGTQSWTKQGKTEPSKVCDRSLKTENTK